ncbi:hypothetical protein A8C32_00640 [Flavivirga aquatica]|uniref:DUF1223 domain-containing protein n=1 Tax=Flavivirga aquatica TaxID=1849968 RepID=A0A1E5TBT4_9FLAO|nr:DUF1223 domain-containing protein [Flavivirga aquatica]OEK08816.1 hypothetical protein A8C32_00640 [Flavivirga aquatica]
MFTSQGCSSCPPADKLLNSVKASYNSKNVIALSYHVDYWNYIGWKDPFSKKRFSDKQRAYGSKFYSSTIYTPQIVVNGKEHFVGSKKEILKDKLKTYLGKPSGNKIVITQIEKNANQVSFNYKVDGTIAHKILRAALVLNERTTSVSRGENKNRVLKNSNIVVEEVYIDLNDATGKANITIPQIVKEADELALVTLVQTNSLDITGGFQTGL